MSAWLDVAGRLADAAVLAARAYDRSVPRPVAVLFVRIRTRPRTDLPQPGKLENTAVADSVNLDVAVLTEDDELVVDILGADLGGNPVPLDPNNPDDVVSDPAQVTLAVGDGPHQHIVRPVVGLVAGTGGAVTFNVRLREGGDPVPVVVPYALQAGAARTVVASGAVRPRTDQPAPTAA